MGLSVCAHYLLLRQTEEKLRLFGDFWKMCSRLFEELPKLARVYMGIFSTNIFPWQGYDDTGNDGYDMDDKDNMDVMNDKDNFL